MKVVHEGRYERLQEAIRRAKFQFEFSQLMLVAGRLEEAQEHYVKGIRCLAGAAQEANEVEVMDVDAVACLKVGDVILTS